MHGAESQKPHSWQRDGTVNPAVVAAATTPMPAHRDRDGFRGCGCGFDENPPVGKPAGLEKTRPQVDPRVHFYTRTRTRGFRAGFGCPRV